MDLVYLKYYRLETIPFLYCIPLGKQLVSYDFLTEEEKRKIFYINAIRFLNLK